MYILTIEANQDKTALESHIRNIDETDKLNEYYRYLNCRCIDMATIDVDGHAYDVVCDDEALLRQPLIPSLYVSEEQVLFGNLVFARNNEDGESVGLEREDMIRLLDYIDRQKESLYRWTEQQIKKKQEMAVTDAG
ncbi:MAG: hypothetical protein E7199_06500 [Schwartzia succinivorans]|nr:hypothetical protein [Schwartzia succinivorans]